MRAIACAGLCAVLLTLAVAGAEADTWYTSPSRTQSINGTVTFEGSGISTACAITLTTTFNSSIAVSAGTTAGSDSGMSWRSCTGGEIRAVLGTPWTIAYSSLSGTTPEAITRALVNVREFALQFSVFGGFVNCLYKGELAIGLNLSGSDDYSVSSASLLSTATLPLFSGPCPSTIHGAGTLTAGESLWRWIFAERLPITASKPFLRREESRGAGREVTFSEAGSGARRATTGSFRTGGTGWTTNFERCLNKNIGEAGAPTCTMDFIAEAGARADQFRV